STQLRRCRTTGSAPGPPHMRSCAHLRDGSGRGPAEVVQRAVTAAEPPLRAARDGPEDVRLRGLDRVRYVEPAGQPGRGGRGEAAPGAVVVRGVDARRPQLARPGAVED